MNGRPTIRFAEPGDAEAISALIRSVAHYFTVDPEGADAERFLATMHPDAIGSYIVSSEFQYVVAEIESEIVGVAAVKGGTHLYHLFVRSANQGSGVGRQLWEHLFQLSNHAVVTVNSTLVAVAVYRHFGFEVAGPKVEKDGIAFVPMTRLR